MKELAVLLAVVDFKRPNLTRPPSLAFLAFLAGLTETEFQDALDRLQQKGLVSVWGDRDGLDVSLSGLLAYIESQAT